MREDVLEDRQQITNGSMREARWQNETKAKRQEAEIIL